MAMQSTTKRLTTIAVSLGLLLSGSLAMAADAPAATPATAAPSITTFPQWTPAQRAQYWEELQKNARDLWARWDLTPAQRQQYWEQIQQGASDLWAKWGLTPEQRQQYLAELQRAWNDLATMMTPPAATPPTAPAIAAIAPATAAVAVAATTATAPLAAAVSPAPRVYNILALWRMTPQQRQEYGASQQPVQ